MINILAPIRSVNIPFIEDKVSASVQIKHTLSEAEELKDTIKPYDALLEAGDVLCSAYRTMEAIIKEEGFNCNVQDILDMIGTKNSIRGYYGDG